MLDKRFDPSACEGEIYRRWESQGAFRHGLDADAPTDGQHGAKPYTIVIPPPNVTGSLHMGHALNSTLQDILCRFERMRGRDVLWQPGVDHAGIATQMVVERQLAAQNLPSRRDLGRDAFVERVWGWKEQSGGIITSQLRRLGASCHWERERFTMDEGLSRAVLKVFVALYKQGLIYKDTRLVNWDPKLQTAISDLEVQQREIHGKLWHFRYPLADDPARHIVVATTRPETMLGDSGIAVHPDDPRYRELVGQCAVLPLVGRKLPIVADSYADPETGSGAVKITPAHDFNDFEVGKRHGLAEINIFDICARLTLKDNDAFLAGVAPNEALAETLSLHGIDRFAARETIVARLDALGLLVRAEDHLHQVPHGDRGGEPIEPYLTEQWYVDARTLARPAIEAVERGETVFVPRQWEKTYFEWMRNIQPWCISRQLWWGHRIPAWYGPDGRVFVEEDENAARSAARRHYGRDVALNRDEDVLDTWFSSALWPFSTLGWPDGTPELARHYKTDVLVTAFDIIFFWVARMMMFGLHFMKDSEGRPEVPFHTVYIHALVRDEKGQKMSKSKGNVIDPLELIDAYGADPLRFALAAMAAQGRDIRLSAQRVEGTRNFGTKLWNAARFCEVHACRRQADFDPASVELTVNRWIVGETERTAAAVTEGLAGYRFNDAANAVYNFIWRVFCDWYLELIKPLLQGKDEQASAEVRATASWALDQALALLHPFMPFITEELWRQTGGAGLLMTRRWPEPQRLAGLCDDEADAQLRWLIGVIAEIRSTRAEIGIAAGAKVPCVFVGADKETAGRARRWQREIIRLARLSDIAFADSAPRDAVQIVLDDTVLALPLAGVVDLGAQRKRLERECAQAVETLRQLDNRLGNKGFLANAAEEVVANTRARRQEVQTLHDKLVDVLARLG